MGNGDHRRLDRLLMDREEKMSVRTEEEEVSVWSRSRKFRRSRARRRRKEKNAVTDGGGVTVPCGV